MYPLYIPGKELFNEETSEFIEVKERTLILEHSLLSLSKWESKWKKPFLDKKEYTYPELIDYIRCMTITTGVPDDTYKIITPDMIKGVWDYINDPMTATWFNDRENKKGAKRGQTVTSELIYYWMTFYDIPFSPCEKWHLNRLLTLIHICEVKNAPSKKMKKKEIYAQHRALNEARRKKTGSKG